MVRKRFITDEWKLNNKGHEKYAFVDVAINDDNLLFIDPCLIENAVDAWSVKAAAHIKSYFDKLYEAYKDRDRKTKRQLLSHAGEQNATHLGYGNGNNGKGNTADGLLYIFRPMENLISQINTVGKAQDLPLLIPGFAEDGMSDLLTNILHECLSDFTVEQMQKHGIPSNGTVSFYTWDMQHEEWKMIERPSYLVKGKELLLVPKWIVRKNYLFGVNQYFMRVILERMIDAGGHRDMDGKPLPKKDILKSKRYSGEHWQYNEAIQYTVANNDALSEYHQRLPGFYMEHGKPMSDDELDSIIYSYLSVKSA